MSSKDNTLDSFRKQMDEMNNITLPAAERAAERAEAAVAGDTHPPPFLEKLHGGWTIVIRGTGPHHNAHPDDANRLSTQFVRKLRAAGHEVTHASFVNGCEESVAEGGEDFATDRTTPIERA